MEFAFLKDETKELFELINMCFNHDYDYKKFKLLDTQRVLLLKNKDELVGCTVITLKKDPFKNTKTFYLDYICVKDTYQHQGLGHKMFQEVERIAREEKVDFLELTSSKKREFARKMYLNEKMEIKDTDLFVKSLN